MTDQELDAIRARAWMDGADTPGSPRDDRAALLDELAKVNGWLLQMHDNGQAAQARIVELEDALDAIRTAVHGLAKKWRVESDAYPATSEGQHARAGVRLCVRELEAALADTDNVPDHVRRSVIDLLGAGVSPADAVDLLRAKVQHRAELARAGACLACEDERTGDQPGGPHTCTAEER